ncbi:hypothetical protein ACVWXM_003054 [Bradyrhizobium sp. GM7.3]
MNATSGFGLVERARAIAPLIAREADEIERTRRLTDPVVGALIENGLYRALLPQNLGGAEAPPEAFMQMLEEIAKADASTAWCLGQCTVCAMIAASLDHDTAQEIFNTAPGILAWGAIAHEARAVEGGYRVTARWDFASGSRQASWLGAHVRIVGADGAPRKNADGSAEVRTILFPVASGVLHDVWQAIGLAGTGTDSYEVADLFIPERFTAFRDVPSALREQGPLLQDRHRLDVQPRLCRGVARRGARHAGCRDRAGARQASVAGGKRHARQPGGPGPDRPHRGRPAGRARLSLCDGKCDVARSLYDRRIQRGTSGLGSPRRDLDHPPIGQSGRHRLSHGRRARRIPQQSVRAPLSRHARHRSADPGARHALRGCR